MFGSADTALVSIGLLAWAVVGIVTALLAGYVTRGDYRVGLDVLAGLAGGLVGGLLFAMLAPGGSGVAASVMGAFAGACAFIAVLRSTASRPSRH